ncbi:RNA polymerase sigma factor [Actinomadura sp. NTSP31]|uniref:RNA polymerase sigma factor n=1 Tax=Actinomadura sp. NTSP31 TaxID=1735447 RepID=UPI0035BF4D93
MGIIEQRFKSKKTAQNATTFEYQKFAEKVTKIAMEAAHCYFLGAAAADEVCDVVAKNLKRQLETGKSESIANIDLYVRRMAYRTAKRIANKKENRDRCDGFDLTKIADDESGLVTPDQVPFLLAFKQALDKLPQEQREVFSCRSLQRMTERQTAEVLGISPSSVRRRNAKARQRMKDIIFPENEKDGGRTA